MKQNTGWSGLFFLLFVVGVTGCAMMMLNSADGPGSAGLADQGPSASSPATTR